MKKEVIIFLLFLTMFITGINGCIPESKIESIKNACINECQKQINEGKNLSSECLLDPIADTDWVCDVAHSPRQSIDNLQENQCKSWQNGTAKHFIEVSPECKFIRSI
ncbi:MAG: hypothetical protein QW041_00320 [Candidatus Pacearchaeota archaeon]